MSNLLNSIIANQPISPKQKDEIPALTLDGTGNVKPMSDKGTLLPSRIFGSPIEYVKDIKQDVVNIKRAAKGNANDHELGRINDLAMKAGSLGLAAYLFVKNPLKLNKAMEFVGFGTFFASMALWPKLTIQLPIKMRTGVDVHQKYIDSQGRKKMLFQDPQYDLTDLYSREDLDKMGEKLKVDKNIPDRDKFIKQRAKKTATQANTLWMLSAFSAPIMSALACNRLEQPIQKGIEQFDILTSSIQMENGVKGPIERVKQTIARKSLISYIKRNADKSVDEKLISELASKIGSSANAASIEDAIKEELKSMKSNFKIDESFIRETLSSIIPESEYALLSEEKRALLDKAISSGSFKTIAQILSPLAKSGNQRKTADKIEDILRTAQKSNEVPKLSEISTRVVSMFNAMASFSAEKGIVDRYVTARIGDKSGTYIANQWGRVGNKLVKVLKLSTKDLKALSEGNMDILTEKLAQLAGNEVEYDKAINSLLTLINDYEAKTNSTFTGKVRQKVQDICADSSSVFQSLGFTKIAEKLTNPVKKGTVENIMNVNTAERITGAQSSFYRLIQSLELFKRINEGSLSQQIAKLLRAEGQKVETAEVNKLVEACKTVVLSATTTDYIEKLKSAGFELSEIEYKTVMRALFDSDIEEVSSIGQSLERTVGSSETVQKMLEGLKSYKKEFMSKIANWQNNVTTDLSRRVATGTTNSANAVERNNLAGKPIDSMIKDIAKQTYNSQKWLKIFGISMAAIVATTLAIGLTFGKKTKIEKQVEEESKVNG